MGYQEDTSYAVRVHMYDGSVLPDKTEELEWFNLKVALRIAGKAWEARNTVTNSPVQAIEIIDADYNTYQRTDFD